MQKTKIVILGIFLLLVDTLYGTEKEEMFAAMNELNFAYEKISDSKKQEIGLKIEDYLIAFVRASEIGSKQNICNIYLFALEALKCDNNDFSEELLLENVIERAISILEDDDFSPTVIGCKKTVQYAKRVTEFLNENPEKKDLEESF